jgi:DNA ligase-1
MCIRDRYKTTSTGKVQQWDIEVDKLPSGKARYIVRHGQIDGKIQETSTLIEVGKNIGKANETSPYEQACNEAQSQWNKKKDRRAYVKDLIQPQTFSMQKLFRPMLAKSYNNPEEGLETLKDGKHITFPCYIQPKLDGIRCTVLNGDGNLIPYSRQGKEFLAINHILNHLPIDIGRNIIDGELYLHENKDNFQDIVSAVKRDKPNDLSEKVEYHIYDVCDRDNLSTDYKDRFNWLMSNIPESDFIKIIPNYTVGTPAKLRARYDEFIALGYEGAIVRNKLGEYKIDGRSKDLQKVKEFQDQEFPIVDAYENKGKQAGQCTFTCKMPDGTTFGVKPKGTAEQREQYWQDWNAGVIKPGALLTVAFFSMTTSDNPVPRFPIGKIIRDYEE